jgi:hypothetical protein
MTNRYPLIIDTADKKLKELPLGDSLIIDGDLILTGNISIDGQSFESTLTIDYSQISNAPIIPSDISDLTDNDDLLSTTNLIGANIFSSTNQLIVDGVNGRIAYSVLTGTPFIPSDISQLTDNQGLLDSGSGSSSFLELTDTPNVYSFGANKFLKVNSSETSVEFGEITQSEIELALGYTPYNGSANPLGFITVEADTLQSVVQRGNSTTSSISVNSVSATSVVSTNANIKTFLEFFDNNQTNQFDILVENGKSLNIAGKLLFNLTTNDVTVSNSKLIGDSNSSIGSSTSYWNNVYSNTVNTELVKNKTTLPITVETNSDIILAMTTANKKVKISGFGTLRLPVLNNLQKNALTPEEGDMIYNQEESTVQIYVGITNWASNPIEPVPGWVNLYTPPPPPA